MSKMAISKAEHNGCVLKYQYSTDGGTTYSALETVTDTFLRDRTKTHVGSVSGRSSLTDDLVEKERFVIYYDTATALDKIYLAGLTQTAGLSFDIYGEDVALDVIPTSQIGTTVAQTVATRPRATANQLLTFTEQTNTCFMVEISGVASIDGGTSTNLLQNGSLVLQGNDDVADWTELDLGEGTLSLAGSTGEEAEVTAIGNNMTASGDLAYLYQNISQTTVVDQDFVAVSFVRKATVTGGTDVGMIRVGTTIDSSTHLEGIITEADEGTTVSYPFSVLSGVALGYFTIGSTSGVVDVGEDMEFGFQNVGLYATSGSVYTGAPLDHRAIFFGVEVYQPEYNYNYGGSLDNSQKYIGNKTLTSNYQFKQNSTRSDKLTLEHQSEVAIKDLEYLDYQLSDGYCFYQRDKDATDPSEFFLANFRHTSRRNDFIDYNSTSITLEEAHEWR